ncbi:ABC transporter substrate-binding protein [Mycetocola reblochoni]|uniref:ABC transporter substrate-binding protein n=2 Tax=Mycetocola reblochoni TaxID=331618 RepID=A0A3L6ZML1_9MICO|nr:ABC transporter substrate-binding protein [Mycetocola reblochoni]RLP69134.1 ABC transporter substrate-binding protein [Mycetocola reblochoni]SJN17448.1 putative iron-siderophore ABC transporter substrate-binding protein [Mycetocola reblochoni REB411]
MTRPPTRRRTALAATLLTSALVLTGCSAQSADDAGTTSSSETVSVDTAFGPVDIPAEPGTVVALEGAVGPLLSAGITPVATADGDNPEGLLPDEYDAVKDLPIVLGPDGWDYEAISAAEPELIIGFVRAGTTEEISPESRDEYERLSGIAPTVFVLAEGSASTKDATLEIAEIVGSGAEAEKAKSEYDAKAAEIASEHADVLDQVTFAPIDHYEGTVTVYTPISWLGGILTDAGATIDPIAAEVTDSNGVDISTEELGTLSDDSVILTEKTVDGQPGLGAEELESVPTYTELPAVVDGRSFGVSYFFADRYETGILVLDQLDGILDEL